MSQRFNALEWLGLLLWLSIHFSSVVSMPESSTTPPYTTLSAFGGYPPTGPGISSDPALGIGEPDVTYCQMLLDASVSPSADQVPWFCICSLCQSNMGPKGDHGERGLSGSPGSIGSRGLTGFRGKPGFVGSQGIKGDMGDEGPKGDIGVVGITGLKGTSGFKGDKGDIGLDGPPGEVGPIGDIGSCPDPCQSVLGIPGEPGLPGPTGTRGLPGVAGPAAATGPKGANGAIGLPGVPGIDGKKGDPGVEGKCNCHDGVNGVNGLQGPKGENGNLGAVGTKGEQGFTGEKGDEGDMGMIGLPGPCSPDVQSAFSVALNIINPPPNKPVVFSRILYNMQDHYDPLTGLYTAPINGTYIFSYHLSVFGRVLKVGLFHNFVPIVKTTQATDLGTASQQVVLHLNTGDLVWVMVKDTTTNGMYSGNEASSTFSGYLLYPDSCDMSMSRDFILAVDGVYTW